MTTLKQLLAESVKSSGTDRFIAKLKKDSQIIKGLLSKGFIKISAASNAKSNEPSYVIFTYQANIPSANGGVIYKDHFTVYFNHNDLRISHVDFGTPNRFESGKKTEIMKAVDGVFALAHGSNDYDEENKKPLAQRLIKNMFNSTSKIISQQASSHGWLRVLEIIFDHLYKFSKMDSHIEKNDSDDVAKDLSQEEIDSLHADDEFEISK